MNEKKKKIIISTCLILVLILAIVGISYAAFQFVGQGQQVNQITTGTIQMNYEEGSNVIRLNNALPTTDETGKVRLIEGEYFDFSVTTNITGDALINWEIAAEDFSDNTFDGSNVKFYLTKLVDGNEEEVSSSLPATYSEQASENKKTGRPANMMSLLTGSTSTQGEEITNYRLRLYVDEKYNPQGDGGGLIFKTRINVYGKVSTEKELPVMRDLSSVTHIAGESAPTRISDDFGSNEYKDKITRIATKKDTMIPETAITITNGKGNYWDESEAGDDSVIAYLEDDGSGNETYEVTIGGNGGIMANVDSTFAFGNFRNLVTLDLSHLNTSNVTDMTGMFYGCSSLISLNLKNFHTSQVASMEAMLYSCSSLTSIDVSSFDTSTVINMTSMFNGCSSLTSIDVSNFNTSKVKNMISMFNNCTNLTSLNLTSFDISNVTNMYWMFYNCSSLTNITVSSLWTEENVTNKYQMFENCGTDHVTVV